MPFKLSIPPPSSDPLGISLVSGFYGPGAWTGWLCSVLTSYYTIIQKPDGENVHDVFLHVAYTNWAAIDVLRHMLLLRGIDSRAREAELAMYGQLGAAMTVTTWGGMHIFLQLWVCLAQSKTAMFTLRLSFWRRWLILAVGLLVPSLSLALFIHFIPFAYYEEEEHSIARFIPALYFPGSNSMHPLVAIRTVSAFAQMQFVFTVSALVYVVRWSDHLLVKGQAGLDFLGTCAYFVGMAWFSFSSGSYRLLFSFPFWAFPLAVIMIFAIHVGILVESLWLVGTYVVKVLGSRGRLVRESCFYMPCAPQGVAEWDQSFTVLCGLAMLAYEVGPACWRVSRALGRRLRWIVVRGGHHISF